MSRKGAVPPNLSAFIRRVEGETPATGRFEVEVNGTVTHRTYWGPMVLEPLAHCAAISYLDGVNYGFQLGRDA